LIGNIINKKNVICPICEVSSNNIYTSSNDVPLLPTNSLNNSEMKIINKVIKLSFELSRLSELFKDIPEVKTTSEELKNKLSKDKNISSIELNQIINDYPKTIRSKVDKIISNREKRREALKSGQLGTSHYGSGGGSSDKSGGAHGHF
jgi:uncharacterized Zn finger protein (UPF0148 family)